MKIAYIITAYMDPQQLKRLITSLKYGASTDFYVHIDKKVDINIFKKVCNDEKINWIENRTFVSWGVLSGAICT